ncbi:sigma-70 family RNA polymerase sigma factor [Acidipila sp. 4G-K13]|nr:sigma-70 family RNA polymerase sigma factor [Paracidobacterium acidisoli]
MMDDSPTSNDSFAWVTLNELSDEDLLLRLISGDHDALTVLFDRYNRLIYSVAIRILRDAGEAEDVVQTVFLNIFTDAANFDPLKGTLRVWLLQYAYHRSINRRRGLSAQGVYLWDELDGVNERSQAPEMELIRLCEQMLMRLKPMQRQVFELTYFEGWTAQEIASRQDRPAVNVRHDLYRGLARLRTALTMPVKNQMRDESATKERKKQIANARIL